MNNFVKLIFTFSLLAVVVCGCEPDSVKPSSNNSVELEAKVFPGNTVDPEANTPVQVDLIDESRNVVGTMDVSNNATHIFLYSSFSHGWLLSDAKFFAGDRNNLPKVNGNEMDLEELPWQLHLQNPSMTSTLQIPRGPLQLCPDFAVWFRAQQFDWWGNVVGQIEGWADGTSILNGYVFQYCAGSVANNNQSNTGNSANN